MNTNIIFLGPLGWKSNIWSKVVTNINMPCNITFIEFPNTEFTDISSYMEECKKKITEIQNGIIIASSYGVLALSYLINKLDFKITGLILIDGLLNPPSIYELESIQLNRTYKYKNISSFLDSTLSLSEKKDPFLKEIVLSTYCTETNEHFMNNDILINYLSYFSDKPNLITNLISTIKSSSYHSYIFNHSYYDSIDNSDNISFELISNESHLLMLTNPKVISDCINKLIT
ncbi:MAG: hypothetical protein ACRC1T_03470 [Clostridium chrysemydis]|uniref:hypothetical protein n=1 Tax=Clostridium chrysemydis TaxID=2665504 RepID=UPI003F3C0B1C